MTMASRKRFYLDVAMVTRKIFFSAVVISLSQPWQRRVGESSIRPQWGQSSKSAAMKSKFRFRQQRRPRFSCDELRLGCDDLFDSATTNMSPESLTQTWIPLWLGRNEVEVPIWLWRSRSWASSTRSRQLLRLDRGEGKSESLGFGPDDVFDSAVTRERWRVWFGSNLVDTAVTKISWRIFYSATTI